MSLNIIDLIKGQLGPALVSQAATQMGESESGISKAISAFLPAIMGGMAHNAQNPSVLDAVSTSHSSGMLNNLMESTSNSSTITMLLSAIFGDKTASLLNSVSSFAGVKNTSATSLLNMVTGATVGSVGKYAADNNLDKNGISKLLEDQKGGLSSLIPAGLSFASLGFSNWFGNDGADKVSAATPVTPVRPVITDEPKIDVNRAGDTHVNVEDNNNNNDGGGSIWKWLLPLLLLLALGFFAWQKWGKKDAMPVTENKDSIVGNNKAPDSVTITTIEKVDQDIDLNGTMIKGYKNGMEDTMIAFLKANKYKDAKTDDELKSKWYNFDKVNFEMASADKLIPGSDVQMKNLVSILKAFPDTKIKIGGYTDKTGDAAVNKDLSQKRAAFLKQQLTDMGVGAQVTDAEGYGSEQATVAATASDAERAVDRNMAVRFTK